jgi:hypothetical protein
MPALPRTLAMCSGVSLLLLLLLAAPTHARRHR